MKDDQVYLRHILDAIEKIETYLTGQTYESFSNNNMIIDAVVRELEIIGEATNHLSDLLRESHPEIPWRDAIDMRNILIHEYFGVRTHLVWSTCKEDLPELKKLIDDLLD
ncbi:MAG: DUF86 domain-containing protein [Planctomycetota bacterium]